MKFKAAYKPELLASEDETRTHINNVHLDCAKSVMVATNGHALVIVPCEPEPGDSSGPVTADSLRAARKESNRRRYDKTNPGPRVRARKKLLDTGAAIFRRPSAASFPPYEQVMPKFKAGDAGTVTFGINPRYLLAALAAMGDRGPHGLLRLTVKISKEMLDPVLVEPGSELERKAGTVAVVMPGRT